MDTVFDNPLTYRTEEELDQIDREAEELMEEAIKFADESPLPEPAEIYEDVYVNYPIDMLKRGTNMEV